MGCLKLAHNEINGPVLRCVWIRKKQSKTRVNLYDYGARFYDPQIGRFTTIDPLPERRIGWSTYAYCLNNPILRFDPNGLTDFTFDKKTGDVKQVGEKNDDPDRILKTNRKGEVKYKKNGEAKIAVGGIEKGILKNGQNFKNDDQVISVGGEGQPSLAGVEDFVTKMGEYVGVEIAGAYLSNEKGADAKISKVYIDEYNGNESQKSSATLTKLYTDESLKSLNLTTDFHTHPSNLGISRTDVERPSGDDLNFRDNNKSFFTKFLILTRTATYPTEVQRIDYTNYTK
jgi:RHS repeat-associated protein